jgi:hypothetical protein
VYTPPSFSFVSVCALHSHAPTFLSCRCAPSIRMPHPNSLGRAFSLAPTLSGLARAATATRPDHSAPDFDHFDHSDTAGLPRPDPDSDGLRVTLAHAALHGLARPAVTLGIATPIRPGPRARSRTRMAPEFAQATLLRPGRAQPLAAPAWTRTTTPNRPGATTPRYANCGRAEAPLGRYGVPVGAATT